jgi:hypothetical protein
MTHRVSLLEESNSKSEYQLPPGPHWWLCRYTDHGHVSEVLFTHESAQTWYQARALMLIELTNLGLSDTEFKVELYE